MLNIHLFSFPMSISPSTLSIFINSLSIYLLTNLIFHLSPTICPICTRFILKMIAVGLCDDPISPHGECHFWCFYSSKQPFLALLTCWSYYRKMFLQRWVRGERWKFPTGYEHWKKNTYFRMIIIDFKWMVLEGLSPLFTTAIWSLLLFATWTGHSELENTLVSWRCL